MSKSASPAEIAAFGCMILAGECNVRGFRCGNADDAMAEYQRAAVFRRKGIGLKDGSISYIPILDPDLQLAYDTAIRRLKP